MPEVPGHHKAIAKHIAAAWNARPRVSVWSAEKDTAATQAIATFEGHPELGVSAFSTVGLSDHGGFEIASAARSKNVSFAKALFDIASYVLDGHRVAEPGGRFEKGVSRFYTRANAGHLLLSTVPLPKLQLPDLALEGQSIRWLYAWPITSDELDLMTKQGLSEFESRLAVADLSVLDLDRRSLPGVPVIDPWAMK